jgi:hypothetical protein
MAIVTGAHCAKHVETAAVDTCVRCGSFVCGACLELAGETAYCEPCYDVVIRTPHSRRSALAVVLTAVSVVLGMYGLIVVVVIAAASETGKWIALALIPFGPGIAGLSMAYQERGRIARGEAPARGKIYADAGIILGWIANAFLLLVFVVVVGAVVRSL